MSELLAWAGIKNLFHIGAHVGVGILIDAQCARSMFYEEIQYSHLWQWLWQIIKHLISNEVTSPAFGCERKFCLLYHRLEFLCAYMAIRIASGLFIITLVIRFAYIERLFGQ